MAEWSAVLREERMTLAWWKMALNALLLPFARRRAIIVAAISFGAVIAVPGAEPGGVTLPGHVPAVVAHLNPEGRLPENQPLRLAIGLPLRDPAGLDDFLAEVYDPASPIFHQFLTPEEFTARFGPTERDYEAVKKFARENGLAIAGTYGNRLLLDVTGPAGNIERAFQLTLLTYQHPTQSRNFFAPDRDPSVPTNLPIADVQGLNNYWRPLPKLHRSSAAAATARGTGSGGDGSYAGMDFRNAYVPGTTLNGAGQMVGLFEADGYYPEDITNYENLLPSRPRVLVQTNLIDEFNGTPTTGPDSGNSEVSLDIEMVIAMATNLSAVVVFEGNPTNYIPNDILNTMAASNMIKNLGCSWGWGGGPSNSTDNIFKQMDAEGQSFADASGDMDAFTPGSNSVNGVDNPSLDNAPGSDPYITQVGAMTLIMNGTGASYASESVWNESYSEGDGSGGGVSSYYAIPNWQMSVSMAANRGSTVSRNVPDVAVVGSNIQVDYGNGESNAFFGTSCSAQLWTGFMALVNQEAASHGESTVGFVNPAIYEIANESLYGSAFHDITVGSNVWDYAEGESSTFQFYAVPGYDLCTGLGTPNGTNLINALVNPDPLVITTNYGFTFSGMIGGPFGITSQTFILTNASASALAWSVVNTSAWLTVSSNGGTLAPGALATVVVSLNSTASNLVAGAYSAGIWFSNLTSQVGHLRSFTFLDDQSIVQNGGFESGDFTDWTLAGDTIVDDEIYNTVVDSNSFTGAAIYIHSGYYGAMLGESGSPATLSQTLPTLSGQPYLLSLWLDNPSNQPTEIFDVNWNTNSSGTHTIYSLTNPPAFVWTNLFFIVTAAGTNTTLQFAEENDQNYFGLDDVSVTPIPRPTITSFGKNASSFILTWPSVAQVAYQVQYNTNLLGTNWVTWLTLTAVTNTLTTTNTNAISASPIRFYRVAEPQ
ncbi:MAG: protease pro-enzyme activation domain-containing protein [Verrucomicrobiota bacterium]